jgi:acyl-CoA reductase-like NAD-dependent aldehyde dehydrogenase
MQLDNPYTGEIIEDVKFLPPEEQKAVLLRSRQAYRGFKLSRVDERVAVVKRMRDYFVANREAVATDITRMMGKPIVQSREEIDTAVERMQAFADMAEEALRPEVVSRQGPVTKSVIREAVSLGL